MSARSLLGLGVAALQAVGGSGLVTRLRTLPVTGPLLSRAYRLAMKTAYWRQGNTGTVAVQGVSFALHDPALSYLPLIDSGREYEPAMTRHLRGLVAGRAPCILDIGAHFGFFTLYLGRLCPQAELHAFEPGAEIFAVLERNVARNGVHARLHRVALSDEAATIPFHDRSMKVDAGVRHEQVIAETFDALAAREGIVPEIVKIDVHGGEGKVLFGMRRALAEDIQHLYCELHPGPLLVDYSMGEILDLLRESGFALYELDRFRRLKEPTFVPLDPERYAAVADERRWSDAEVLDRRMIYATKQPV